MTHDSRSVAVAALLIAAAALSAYWLDVGHGFLRDDFAWIEGARENRGGGALDAFRRHQGFYRPLVSLAFMVNERTSGLDARAYGITNLGLALLTAACVGLLARAVQLSPFSSVIAAGVWLLNPHGINMAVLWISGRTSLLLTLFGTLAAAATARGWHVLSGGLALCAMLSKEEAVVLPFLLPAVAWVSAGNETRQAYGRRILARSALPSLLALGIYFLLRANTGAHTPTTAPSFYRFTFELSALARNIAEYSDRAWTFAFVICLVVAAASWSRPHLAGGERRVVGL